MAAQQQQAAPSPAGSQASVGELLSPNYVPRGPANVAAVAPVAVDPAVIQARANLIQRTQAAAPTGGAVAPTGR